MSGVRHCRSLDTGGTLARHAPIPADGRGEPHGAEHLATEQREWYVRTFVATISISTHSPVHRAAAVDRGGYTGSATRSHSEKRQITEFELRSREHLRLASGYTASLLSSLQANDCTDLPPTRFSDTRLLLDMKETEACIAFQSFGTGTHLYRHSQKCVKPGPWLTDKH